MNQTHKNKILIVDDNETNLTILAEILSPDYTVYTGMCGVEAITKAEELQPDVILLDILMPDLDGFGVISVLKYQESTKKIPVIFISGLDSEEDEITGLEYGAADYIAKPFHPSIVRLRVRNQIKIINQAELNRKLNSRLEHELKNIIEAQQLADLMLNSSPMCAQIWDRNLNVIDCNDAAVRLYKFGSKSEYAERFKSECSPERQPCGRLSAVLAVERVDEAFKVGKVVCEWTHVIPGTGELMPAEVTLVRVAYRGDYVVVGYTRDLREQKKLQQHLESRDRLLTASARVSALLFNTEVHTFEQHLVNSMKLIAETINVTNMEIWKNSTIKGELYSSIRFAWPELGPDSQLNKLYKYNGIAPEFETILSLGNCINCIVRDLPEKVREFLSKAGTKSILMIPIFAENKFWGFVGFGDVLRERVFFPEEVTILQSIGLNLVNAFLRNEETQKTKRMIDELPGMVYICEFTPHKYPLTFVSKGSYDLIGYIPEELVGVENTFWQMAHPDDVAKIEETCKATINVGKTFELNYRLLMPDGSVKWVWERTRPLEYNPDGTPRLVEGYVFDVSDRYKLEAAEAGNEAKSMFLAHMSHEIRTPMNSIIGFAELALESNPEPQIEQYLSKILDSSKWLLDILNDILDISKIESGKMELEMLPFELNEVISRCSSIFLPAAKEKDIELIVKVDELTGRKLIGDSLRLYQVFMNLLSNAMKFTSTGTVKLTCVIKKKSSRKVRIRFTVEDTGIGMTAEQIEKVFDPFVQAESGTTREYGGTGLGLAIIKSIIEKMGGKLILKSKLGTGSAFSFALEFDTVENDSAEATQADSKLLTVEKPYFKDVLILVCDDSSLNRQVICAHLSRVGIDVEVAENGKVGANKVKRKMLAAKDGAKQYDLILMDVFMPVMDGIEAAAKIKKSAPHIPIVAMTANVMINEIEKYQRVGMKDCLGKPFTSQDLWRLLLKYFTPEHSNAISKSAIAKAENELTKRLRSDFVRKNKHKFHEISDAISRDDITTAHRLVHTLKGNAGQLGSKSLFAIAEKIEYMLLDHTLPVPKHDMKMLRNELKRTLAEFEQLIQADVGAASQTHAVNSSNSESLKSLEATALLAKLSELLKDSNAGCLGLIPELSALGGERVEKLICEIDEYDFEVAAETLSGIMQE